MSKGIKEEVVTELIPNNRAFEKLTWIPREVDPPLPIPSTELLRHANLSKRDPGTIMWWAHNGIQIHDQDWDLNMAYFSNQMNEEGLPAPWPVQVTSTTDTIPIITPTLTPGHAPVSSIQSLAGIGRKLQYQTCSSSYPGSTRRSKHGQPKKPRRQMEFKCKRMHCPGDENIIPLYSPVESDS